LKLATALGRPENSARRLLDSRHRSQIWVIDGDGEDERGTLNRSAESAGGRTGGVKVDLEQAGANAPPQTGRRHRLLQPESASSRDLSDPSSTMTSNGVRCQQF